MNALVSFRDIAASDPTPAPKRVSAPEPHALNMPLGTARWRLLIRRTPPLVRPGMDGRSPQVRRASKS
ncbi:hypothetical protein ABIA40_000436 [Bradyrhizobium sp. USDA 223]